MKARRKSPVTAGKVAINRKKQDLMRKQEAQAKSYREAMQGLREYKQELDDDFDTLVQDYIWENAELRRKYAEAVQQLRDMQQHHEKQLGYITSQILAAASGKVKHAVVTAKSKFFGG